jgi:hypothetical protein
LRCGKAFSPKRHAIGKKTCLPCGDQVAVEERSSWTVVQQYGKGPYQLVTQGAASEVLKSTNQKEVRV